VRALPPEVPRRRHRLGGMRARQTGRVSTTEIVPRPTAHSVVSPRHASTGPRAATAGVGIRFARQLPCVNVDRLRP
jgi:hypothetical protein